MKECIKGKGSLTQFWERRCLRILRRKEKYFRMSKVLLTVTQSRCRCGYSKAGDTFAVEDLCPPICHELWNNLRLCMRYKTGRHWTMGTAKRDALTQCVPTGAEYMFTGKSWNENSIKEPVPLTHEIVCTW